MNRNTAIWTVVLVTAVTITSGLWMLFKPNGSDSPSGVSTDPTVLMEKIEALEKENTRLKNEIKKLKGEQSPLPQIDATLTKFTTEELIDKLPDLAKENKGKPLQVLTILSKRQDLHKALDFLNSDKADIEFGSMAITVKDGWQQLPSLRASLVEALYRSKREALIDALDKRADLSAFAYELFAIAYCQEREGAEVKALDSYAKSARAAAGDTKTKSSSALLKEIWHRLARSKESRSRKLLEDFLSDTAFEKERGSIISALGFYLREGDESIVLDAMKRLPFNQNLVSKSIELVMIPGITESEARNKIKDFLLNTDNSERERENVMGNFGSRLYFGLDSGDREKKRKRKTAAIELLKEIQGEFSSGSKLNRQCTLLLTDLQKEK